MVDPYDLSHEELAKAFINLQEKYYKLKNSYEISESRRYSAELAAENWYDHEQNQRSKQGIFG